MTEQNSDFERLRRFLGINPLNCENFIETFWKARAKFITRMLQVFFPVQLYAPLRNSIKSKIVDANPTVVHIFNAIYIAVAIFGIIATYLGRNGEYQNLVYAASILLNIRLGVNLLNTSGWLESGGKELFIGGMSINMFFILMIFVLLTNFFKT